MMGLALDDPTVWAAADLLMPSLVLALDSGHAGMFYAQNNETVFRNLTDFMVG
jgi:hypothetical protein